MPPKLDKASRKDPKFRAIFILYEFQSGKPIFECFKDFCARMGSKFMDYREFEFWFMRFSAGNFDVDYDRSQDPKCRTITDMPLHVFEKICENLGDDYQENYWFTFRHVCKSFRAFVDSWDPPKFKTIEIGREKNSVELKFDSWSVCYQEVSDNWSQVKFSNDSVRFSDGKENYGNFVSNQSGNFEDLAIDTLLRILAHSEGYKLENLTIAHIFNNRFSKKSFEKFQNLKTKIKVHTVKLYCIKPILVNNILNGFPSIKKIDICPKKWPPSITQQLIDKINGIDALKNAEMVRIEIWGLIRRDRELLLPRGLKVPKLILKCGYLYNDAFPLVQILLESPHLKYCHIDAVWEWPGEFEAILKKLGAEKDPENPDLYKYQIPDSDDYFDIKIKRDVRRIRIDGVYIERNYNSS
ncbi:unnamed protein product [Caenorhabditis nigoni]